MKNLNLVLENTCIEHMNRNSRLCEAVAKAVSENKVNILCEAFDSIMNESVNVSNGKVKQFFVDSWNAVKKFFLTILNNIKSIAMEYKSNFKSDINFINKNKDKIKDALSKLSEDECMTSFVDIKRINPITIETSIINELFVNCDTSEEMQAKVDHNVKILWNKTFGESDIKDTNNESKSDMVYRILFTQRDIKSINVNNYISETSSIVDEIVKTINTLTDVLVNSEKVIIRGLGGNDEDVNNEFIKLLIDKYKICIRENIACLKLALDLCLKSKNNIMAVVKKAIKKSN